MSCYTGRGFTADGIPQCKLDDSCIWGAPSNRNLAWAAASVAVRGLLFLQGCHSTGNLNVHFSRQEFAKNIFYIGNLLPTQANFKSEKLKDVTRLRWGVPTIF